MSSLSLSVRFCLFAGFLSQSPAWGWVEAIDSKGVNYWEEKVFISENK